MHIGYLAKVTSHNFHATDNQIAIQSNFVTCLNDADNRMTIYGHSGKLYHMLSMTLMIQ